MEKNYQFEMKHKVQGECLFSKHHDLINFKLMEIYVVIKWKNL